MSASCFPSAEQAAEAIAKLLSKDGALEHPRPPDATWLYRHADGSPAGAVLRWNRRDGGKEIRPLRCERGEDGAECWAIGAMPEPRPLYRLPEIVAAPLDRPVVVVEGEKAADALQDLLTDAAVVTTSPGGARAAEKADWRPLRGRRVYVWPDFDDAGEQYAEAVAGLCHNAGAAFVAVLNPAELAGRELRADGDGGWDGADAVAECEGDAERLTALRNRILQAIADARQWWPWE
jgi:hypothetical protein